MSKINMLQVHFKQQNLPIRAGYFSNLKISNKASRNHGGARNFKNKISSTLSRQQCEKVILDATQSDLPLNRLITVSFARQGIERHQAAEATKHLLKLIRDFAKRNKVRIPLVYVREDSKDLAWPHVHILIHIPAQIKKDFNRKLRFCWIELITGMKCQKKCIQTKTIGRNLKTAFTNPNVFMINLIHTIAYLLKAHSKDCNELFGNTKNCPSIVIGKRSGSNGIGFARVRVSHIKTYIIEEFKTIVSAYLRRKEKVKLNSKNNWRRQDKT